MRQYACAVFCGLSLLFSEMTFPSDNDSEGAGQEGEVARIHELSKQLDDEISRKKVLADRLVDLEGKVADLMVASQQLSGRQAALLDAQARGGAVEASSRVLLNDAASTDVRASYVLGVGYAGSASQETQKLALIGKKMDLLAFSQGFNDAISNRIQLSRGKVEAELVDMRRQLSAMARSENQKRSQSLLAAAAAEQDAVKMAGGVIYRVLTKGEAPGLTDQSEVLFEFEEQLGTGEVLAARETRNSQVKRLPPPFRTIFKKLGLGGAVKIYIPISQPQADSDMPSESSSPDAVSIIMVKVVGIK